MITRDELLVKSIKLMGYGIYALADHLIMYPLFYVFNKITWKNYCVHPRIFELAYKVRNKIEMHLDDVREKGKNMAEELDTDCYVFTGMRAKEFGDYFRSKRNRP